MTPVISDEELERLLAASPAERITRELIYSKIKSVEYIVRDTLTLCIITLSNGFKATGEGACVEAKNYNRLIGEKVSYENAFSQLWKLYGFLLAEKASLRAGMMNVKEKENA